RGDAVHHFLVDRDAHRGREPPIALEGRDGAARADELLDVRVDLERGHPRLHARAQAIHHLGQDVAAAPHQTDLAAGLELDHRGSVTARRMAAPMADMAPSPLMVESTPRPR